jgi:hypothetical protein
MNARNGSEPVCWWCKIRIPLEAPYRGEAPELGLPAGVGVIVCTPACPERPESRKVYTHRGLRELQA